MKTVCVHQPYFFPWLGYLNKLAQCDYFVCLDDVGFRNRFYINRAKILLHSGKPHWLTVPIGDHPGRPLQDIRIGPGAWMERLIRTLQETYRDCVGYNDVLDMVASVLPKRETGIVPLCLESIRVTARLADLKMPEIYFSSALGLPNERTERLIRACNLLGVRNLLLGSGTSSSIHDLDRIRANGIQIYFQDYMCRHIRYFHKQSSDPDLFVPGLSCIDVAMNVTLDRLKNEIVLPCTRAMAKEQNLPKDH